MSEQFTPGPWRKCGGATPNYTAVYADGHGYIVYRMADRMTDREHGVPILAPGDDAQRANARLIASAPAQEALLQLLARGLARFEGIEFCFNGLRYTHRNDWNVLASVIGWDKISAALSRPEPGGP